MLKLVSQCRVTIARATKVSIEILCVWKLSIAENNRDVRILYYNITSYQKPCQIHNYMDE